MGSPFPGMDPYLENPELWSAVHSRLIVAIADELVDYLSEKYRVEVEKRVYFSSDDESVLVGIPDVAVATRNLGQRATNTVTLPLPVQPEQVTVPMATAVTERYLEIREVATGMVVTVIELLSPTNKRPGEGRMAYLRKRNQVLASGSHLVEIGRGDTEVIRDFQSLNRPRMLKSPSKVRHVDLDLARLILWKSLTALWSVGPSSARQLTCMGLTYNNPFHRFRCRYCQGRRSQFWRFSRCSIGSTKRAGII